MCWATAPVRTKQKLPLQTSSTETPKTMTHRHPYPLSMLTGMDVKTAAINAKFNRVFNDTSLPLQGFHEWALGLRNGTGVAHHWCARITGTARHEPFMHSWGSVCPSALPMRQTGPDTAKKKNKNRISPAPAL